MLLRATRSAIEQPLVPTEIVEPLAGPGEVRLRVHVCGVCHTDLHIVEGDLTLPRLPLVPGHQIVGVVDQVGAGVTRFRAGDRAGLPWLRSACGECRY
ncbi:MAG: alcohol dehydrogenase catalytic domain-containing protein, partial [Anaerolineae bacterium]|nr:alcohol dehydrogenase catalytic domain-containing protein [Anaerolineae bacterium]